MGNVHENGVTKNVSPARDSDPPAGGVLVIRYVASGPGILDQGANGILAGDAQAGGHLVRAHRMG
jgi:hypothetical protein